MEKSKGQVPYRDALLPDYRLRWIALCTVGLISHSVICTEARKKGKEAIGAEVNHIKVLSNV